MIVSVKAPAGAVEVRYGLLTFRVADDGTLDLPAYVAKTLVALPGFSSTEDLSKTAAMLLAAGESWEANYLLQAYGKSADLSVTGEIKAAVDAAHNNLASKVRALELLQVAFAPVPAEGEEVPPPNEEDTAILQAARQAVDDAQAALDAALAPYDEAMAGMPKTNFDAAKALMSSRGAPLASVI